MLTDRPTRPEVKRYLDTKVHHAVHTGDDDGLPESFVGAADYDALEAENRELKQASRRWWREARSLLRIIWEWEGRDRENDRIITKLQRLAKR